MEGKKIKPERMERKIHKPPWCRKWHSRLNIMLLVTASVADRLVGCWLERDCLPVCCRSRPHTLLTSAMEQQTITASLQSYERPDRTSPSHTINKVHAVFTENATFFFTFHSQNTLSIFCSPFLRQMLCERHDVPIGPGSEMWIYLTMQFKEIHIKKGATTSTWDVLVILPCQKCHRRLRLNVIYFSHSSIYLLNLFTNLPLNLFFYLKEKCLVCYSHLYKSQTS
ncbi:hypothetical protein PFLUV_G00233650 [Perca fluviatilis]|uniref:Uncharacterized protein n=1 Tax=Perca fluviatilis TaxID=8168 RepID=A0A6A5E368_PERFL|nr:hypothetical protein PFLUV_G00233650 [Perca fluviatilis]